MWKAKISVWDTESDDVMVLDVFDLRELVPVSYKGLSGSPVRFRLVGLTRDELWFKNAGRLNKEFVDGFVEGGCGDHVRKLEMLGVPSGCTGGGRSG
jgi:hypothetical protein